MSPRLVIEERVFFAPGSDAITHRGEAIVHALAATLIERGDITHVELEGHTDDHEVRKSRRIKLATERAEALRRALVERGVEPDRLSIAAYGDSRPYANDATPDGRAINRRVSFRVVETLTRGPARVFPALRPVPSDDTPPSDFRPTVFWASRVLTDADGRATVRFSLSDAATTFSAVAEGAGGAYLGRGETTLTSRRP